MEHPTDITAPSISLPVDIHGIDDTRTYLKLVKWRQHRTVVLLMLPGTLLHQRQQPVALAHSLECLPISVFKLRRTPVLAVYIKLNLFQENII
jgi:hypothetical protein